MADCQRRQRAGPARPNRDIFLLGLDFAVNLWNKPASFVEEPMRSIRSIIALTAASRPSNRPSDRLYSCVFGFMQQTKKPELGLTLRPE
jgi:hypothetical protein